MKRIPSFGAAVLLAAVLAVLAGCAGPRQSNLESMARLHDRLVEAHSASAVTVSFYFQSDRYGRPPTFAVGYNCPNCQALHAEMAAKLMMEERPFRVPGYLIAPDRVVVPDIRLRPEWLKSIVVEGPDGNVAGDIAVFYPDERAMLIACETDVPGGRPLAFSPAAPGEPLFDFYLVEEMRSRVSGVTPHAPGRLSRNQSTGKHLVTFPAGNLMVVREDGSLVTLSMPQERWFDGEMNRPPAQWRTVSADDRQAEAVAMEEKLAGSVYPVRLRFEASDRSKAGRGGQGGDELENITELYTVGVLFDSGDLVIPLGLPPALTARLDKVFVVDGGRTVEAGFAGSVRDFGALVVRPEEPLSGPGAAPYTDSLANLYLEPAYAVEARNYGGEFELNAVADHIENFSTGYRSILIPATWHEDEFNLLFAPDGRVLAVMVAQRGDGQTSVTGIPDLNGYAGEVMVPASVFALAIDDPESGYDSLNEPVKAEMRRQIAWLGVTTQPLNSDLARANKVAQLTNDGRNGLLITKVYPGSPAQKLGLKGGDILLKVTDPVGKTTLLSGGSQYNAGASQPMWEYYDQLPEYMLEDMPTPWPDAKSPLNVLLTGIGIGREIELGVISGGELRSERLVLEQSPPVFDNAPRYTLRDAGLTVAEMTFEVRDYFQFAPDAPGVLITRIRPGTRAAIAGLKPYEVITRVDSQPVYSLDEFKEAVAGKGPVQLEVLRLSQSRLVNISF